jgi:hypothetical protein
MYVPCTCYSPARKILRKNVMIIPRDSYYIWSYENMAFGVAAFRK